MERFSAIIRDDFCWILISCTEGSGVTLVGEERSEGCTSDRSRRENYGLADPFFAALLYTRLPNGTEPVRLNRRDGLFASAVELAIADEEAAWSSGRGGEAVPSNRANQGAAPAMPTPVEIGIARQADVPGNCRGQDLGR